MKYKIISVWLKTAQFQFGFSALTTKLRLLFICRKTHSYEVWIKLRDSNFACGEWRAWAKSSLSLSPCTHPPSQSGGLSVLPCTCNLGIQQSFGKSKNRRPNKTQESSEQRPGHHPCLPVTPELQRTTYPEGAKGVAFWYICSFSLFTT